MDKIASLELQTFVDEPVAQFRIDVFNPTRYQRLRSVLTRKPLHKDFVIYRARVCNLGRAAAIANEIEELTGDINSLHDLTKLTLPLIHEHRLKIVRLIACCIHNRHDEPPSWLTKYLDVNMSNEILFDVLITCLHNSGLQSFLSATMLIKGTNVNFATDTDAQPATEQV